jgi:hypothetical protein
MNTLRTWFWIFFLAASVYTVWRVVPSYVANYALENTIDTAARFGAMEPGRSEDELRNRVLQEAQSLHIPLQAEQVYVQRIPNDVLIWGDYTIHVDLPVYPLDLHFQPMSKSKRRTM